VARRDVNRNDVVQEGDLGLEGGGEQSPRLIEALALRVSAHRERADRSIVNAGIGSS
jgi:hypothetical protein